eukprot:14560904-Ditylum_brightwellii.AAC.1
MHARASELARPKVRGSPRAILRGGRPAAIPWWSPGSNEPAGCAAPSGSRRRGVHAADAAVVVVMMIIIVS